MNEKWYRFSIQHPCSYAELMDCVNDMSLIFDDEETMLLINTFGWERVNSKRFLMCQEREIMLNLIKK